MTHPSIHRGPAPEDARFFSAQQMPALRSAMSDLCWLLDHGYASHSALELVGNRHALASRQRMAVSRCACSFEEKERRQHLRIEPAGLRGNELWIDAYNVITILESALAGGLVLLGRDGCCRDIAGIHRRYRKVHETLPVLQLLGTTLAAWGVGCCRWWIDKPVSNSGRLKMLIIETAQAAGWPMEVELVFSPDHVLAHTDQIIATSDGIVLDRCRQWVNLARTIIAQHIPETWLLDLS